MKYVSDKVNNQIKNQIKSYLHSKVCDKVNGKIEHYIWGHISFPIWNQSLEETRDKIVNQLNER